MAFADSFSEALSAAGVDIDPASVPDRAFVEADLDALAVWLSSLEEDTRLAIDEVTATNAIQASLADGSVGIVEAIGDILAAFDAQPASISVSAALDMMRSAAERATD